MDYHPGGARYSAAYFTTPNGRNPVSLDPELIALGISEADHANIMDLLKAGAAQLMDDQAK